MPEFVILPEMVDAGREALQECRERGLGEVDSAIAVYLAMSAVWEMAVLREQNTTRH